MNKLAVAVAVLAAPFLLAATPAAEQLDGAVSFIDMTGRLNGVL